MERHSRKIELLCAPCPSCFPQQLVGLLSLATSSWAVTCSLGLYMANATNPFALPSGLASVRWFLHRERPAGDGALWADSTT